MQTTIPDYRHLTCTNLMIKIKILLKKMPAGQNLQFFATREQKDNLGGTFIKSLGGIKVNQEDDNKYLIDILK